MNTIQKFLLILGIIYLFSIPLWAQNKNDTGSKTNSEFKKNTPFYLSDQQTNYVNNNLKNKYGSNKNRYGKGGNKRLKKPFLYPWGAFLINFFVPIGLGSYLQTDFSAAVVQTLLVGIGIGLFLTSYYGLVPEDNKSDRGFRDVTTFFTDIFTNFRSHPVRYGVYVASLLAFVSAWLVGILAPWTFPKRQRDRITKRKRRKRVKRKVSSTIQLNHTIPYHGTISYINIVSTLPNNNQITSNQNTFKNTVVFDIPFYSKYF